MTLFDRLKGKRVGVVLSAGFFGFYGHAGFVEGLFASGLDPESWAGASAGGLVAAFAAAGMPAERIVELVLSQRREHFWDPDYLGIAVDAVKKGHRPSGLLSGRRFRSILEAALPVATFEALPRPLILVATNLTQRSSAVLTQGDLASAVHATCAYPGLFQAVRRDGELLWDGGLVDKAPLVALRESKAGSRLDAILVHYLPSRESASEPKGVWAWPSGLAAGVDALRRDHFRLQLKVLEAQGFPVYVVESRLPQVTPKQMGRGAEALAAGRQAAVDALASRSW